MHMLKLPLMTNYFLWAFHVVVMVKNAPTGAGDITDVGLIPGSGRYPGVRNGNPLWSSCLGHPMDRGEGSILESGRSPRVGNGNPLQYSCLENPMDRGAWWATVYGVTKSWTQLKRPT